MDTTCTLLLYLCFGYWADRSSSVLFSNEFSTVVIGVHSTETNALPPGCALLSLRRDVRTSFSLSVRICSSGTTNDLRFSVVFYGFLILRSKGVRGSFGENMFCSFEMTTDLATGISIIIDFGPLSVLRVRLSELRAAT